MDRFAQIGIGPGLPFDPEELSPEMLAAFEGGIADAWKEFDGVNAKMAAGEITTGDLFGTREYLTTYAPDTYLNRFAGAKIGLYGNSKEEACYPMYTADANGEPFNGAHRYEINLTEALPAKAFASITMYNDKQLLVENDLNRYLVNSPMIEDFVRDDGTTDGPVTIYIQKDSPGEELKANWLPAPEGDFFMALRLYLPEQDVIDGKWQPPQVVRVSE